MGNESYWSDFDSSYKRRKILPLFLFLVFYERRAIDNEVMNSREKNILNRDVKKKKDVTPQIEEGKRIPKESHQDVLQSIKFNGGDDVPNFHVITFHQRDECEHLCDDLRDVERYFRVAKNFLTNKLGVRNT